MTSYFECDYHQNLVWKKKWNESNILMYLNSNNKSVILYMYNKQEVMGSW